MHNPKRLKECVRTSFKVKRQSQIQIPKIRKHKQTN